MKWPTAVLAAGAVLVGTIAVLAPVAGADQASNGYPYCADGGATDPDGDGWGWENERSCVVRGSGADPGPAAAGAPAACPPAGSCGAYAIGGLGARKQEVLAAGGSVLDLAVAMLESDGLRADYPYGDGKPGDAANFGIFKQNWQMLRESCDRFAGQGPDAAGSGALLNGDLGQDVSCLHQSQQHYGLDAWFAGHRNGASGLADPDTADIAAYRTAVYWIRDQLAADPANLGNDTRFWVSVPAI